MIHASDQLEKQIKRMNKKMNKKMILNSRSTSPMRRNSIKKRSCRRLMCNCGDNHNSNLSISRRSSRNSISKNPLEDSVISLVEDEAESEDNKITKIKDHIKGLDKEKDKIRKELALDMLTISRVIFFFKI